MDWVPSRLELDIFDMKAFPSQYCFKGIIAFAIIIFTFCFEHWYFTFWFLCIYGNIFCDILVEYMCYEITPIKILFQRHHHNCQSNLFFDINFYFFLQRGHTQYMKVFKRHHQEIRQILFSLFLFSLLLAVYMCCLSLGPIPLKVNFYVTQFQLKFWWK